MTAQEAGGNKVISSRECCLSIVLRDRKRLGLLPNIGRFRRIPRAATHRLPIDGANSTVRQN